MFIQDYVEPYEDSEDTCDIEDCGNDAVVLFTGSELLCHDHAEELCQHIMKMISNETRAGTTHDA